MALIEVRGVKKRFGDNLVLDNLDLDIKEGDIFGLVGINGSGKTTLLKVLMGFYKPDEGKILYKGADLRKSMSAIRKDFGFTTQENSFYPKLTVFENLNYFGSLYGLARSDIKNNVSEIMTLLELNEFSDFLAENLSGGMQRRLDMACSLIHNPKILILDEPTEDLDPILRREIVRLIKKINGLGTTVIITSHLLDDIEILCDSIAVLHNGKIVIKGSIEELRRLYGKVDEVHIEIASGNYEGILKALHIQKFNVDEGKLVVYSENAERILHEILHIIENEDEKLVYVDVKKPSLLDVFNRLTNKKWLEN